MFTLLVVLAFLALASAGTINTALGNSTTLTTGSTTCGSNCPGGCATCPCGSTSSVLDIKTWCAKYSGWNQANCQCIMKYESGGNANAVNQNTGGSYDVGLWQINDFNWGSCSGGKAPCDATSNLNCAIKVWQWGGNTWKNWSTCSKCGACSSA